MGKRPHKRQKTEKHVPNPLQPLGVEVGNTSLMDDVSKDDEERRLESMLFGKPYVPAPEHENVLLVSDNEYGEEMDGGKELQNLLDTDVSSLRATQRAFIEHRA